LRASWEDVYEEAFAVPPGACGAWTGQGLDHGRGHLLRAALEGVAFALRKGLEALEDTLAPDPGWVVIRPGDASAAYEAAYAR
jgi:sugar (pentulose or hexulose) kinase